MTLDEKIRITERNVSQGLQGQADLDSLKARAELERKARVRAQQRARIPAATFDLAELAAFDAEAPQGARRPDCGTVPLAALLKHMGEHYTDYQLKNDLECVLSLCASDDDRREARRFAKAKLAGEAYEGAVSLDSKRCESCGRSFNPRRNDAKFCSASCRVRASRRNR